MSTYMARGWPHDRDGTYINAVPLSDWRDDEKVALNHLRRQAEGLFEMQKVPVVFVRTLDDAELRAAGVIETSGRPNETWIGSEHRRGER